MKNEFWEVLGKRTLIWFLLSFVFVWLMAGLSDDFMPTFTIWVSLGFLVIFEGMLFFFFTGLKEGDLGFVAVCMILSAFSLIGMHNSHLVAWRLAMATRTTPDAIWSFMVGMVNIIGKFLKHLLSG